MPNYGIGSEGPRGGRVPARVIPGNPDYARFQGGRGVYDPNAGIISNRGRGVGHGSPGARGMYDPHGADRFRYAPPSRHSFRQGRAENQVDYRHNVGSPGNWGWDQRTHLGNDQHHPNVRHNSYGWNGQNVDSFYQMQANGDRGHFGHGHSEHRMPDHGSNPWDAGNNYGGRRYSFGNSRHTYGY